jgi:hypothetical protein
MTRSVGDEICLQDRKCTLKFHFICQMRIFFSMEDKLNEIFKDYERQSAAVEAERTKKIAQVEIEFAVQKRISIFMTVLALSFLIGLYGLVILNDFIKLVGYVRRRDRQ